MFKAEQLSKWIFIAGIVITVCSIISNIDSTLYYNSTQYVAEGDQPDPLRMTEILRDIVSPFYNFFVLWGLSYVVRILGKREEKQESNQKAI
jgi:hypothetical protein